MIRRIAFLALVVLSAASSGCPAERQGDDDGQLEIQFRETADEFLNSFTTAMRQDNRAAMLALFNWKGVSEVTRERQEKTLDRILQRQVESVVLTPRPENYRGGGVRNGIRYRPNVEIEGMFEVTFAGSDAGAIRSLSLPYGISEGRYFIAGIIEEPTGYEGPADRSINIAVIAGGAPAAVGFEGSCTYFTGGEVKRQKLDGEGNLSRAFWGQSVTKCSLRRSTGSGWIELRISEGGERIYESGRIESDQSIEFAPSAQ